MPIKKRNESVSQNSRRENLSPREPKEALSIAALSERDWRRRRFAVYVLGAGFSRAAGLPLATELWDEVRCRASRLTGRAEQFKRDLKDYVQFQRACGNRYFNERKVDFEEFLGALDVEHYLGLRGGDSWSRDGNETQVVIKTLIGQILTEKTPPVSLLPKVYFDFARRLQPGDVVLTLNYDTILEKVLEATGKPFRLFSSRVGAGGIVDSEKDDKEVVVLKLHGSVDWFSNSGYINACKEWRKWNNPSKPTDPIFNSQLNLQVTALAPVRGGPPSLRHIRRVMDVERYYSAPSFFLATPFILNPSTSKVVYASWFEDFWRGLNHVGVMNLDLSIIGFSLPDHDEYLKQVLYRIVRNYQCNHWGKGVFGRRKRALTLVDFQQTKLAQATFKKRYGFVDWSKAKVLFNGFTPKVVSAL